MSLRLQDADRLVEIGKINIAPGVGRQSEGVKHARIRSGSAVAGVARDTISTDGGDDTVRIDLPDTLAEEIGEEKVAGTIDRKAGDEA